MPTNYFSQFALPTLTQQRLQPPQGYARIAQFHAPRTTRPPMPPRTNPPPGSTPPPTGGGGYTAPPAGGGSVSPSATYTSGGQTTGAQGAGTANATPPQQGGVAPLVVPGTTGGWAYRQQMNFGAPTPNYAPVAMTFQSQYPELTAKMQEVWGAMPTASQTYLATWDPRWRNALIAAYAMGNTAEADKIHQDYVQWKYAQTKQQQTQIQPPATPPVYAPYFQ